MSENGAATMSENGAATMSENGAATMSENGAATIIKYPVIRDAARKPIVRTRKARAIFAIKEERAIQKTPVHEHAMAMMKEELVLFKRWGKKRKDE
ncbi:hypothetical protein TNCT_398961 [Trichonephila clavata]|uniref:Uncharacterized protein n=1 Tax=Trichonephila clavata TaxID=2740835 RepID=A0A8X6IAS8_TRICU|nr:hypothetical protein TNCT_398961 [Trichonephila clavata]